MLTDWNQARSLLADATCLWQDLDGLHHQSIPESAPPTSILWAWWDSPDLRVARLRIDGDTVYLAVARWPSDSTHTIAWGGDDGRVQSYRSHTIGIPLTSRFDYTVIDELTFLRPFA